MNNLSEILKTSLIIAAGSVVVLPLIGLIVHAVSSFVLQNVFGLFSRSGALYLFFANTLTFPGVVYHELSHALFAFLTGAKINEIKLYQKKEGHLGYVNYSPRGAWGLQSLQLTLASCAPVVTGMIAEAVIYYVFTTFTLPIWGKVLLIYLGVSILVHMDMSTADLKSYVRGVFFVMILVFIGSFFYLYFYGPAI
ncbi:MAG: hypothetical protein K6E75_14190 [Lachnospiraceae bacterium]|nr:hypothetical protein [Lachnospiraceae bacterium]